VLLLSEPDGLAELFAVGAFFGCAGRVAGDALGSGGGASGGGAVSRGMGESWHDDGRDGAHAVCGADPSYPGTGAGPWW
jgi:hypothetical protein